MKVRLFVRFAVPILAITLSAVPLVAQDWGDKMFDGLQIKFGNVARLADASLQVKIKNPYVDEIQVTSLTTSCGCISWTDRLPISIPSKAERELTIRLDTIRHVGDKHVKAFVTLNDPIKGLTSNVTLSVEGRIRNDIEVRPSSVGFGTVDLGQGHTQRISVTHNGKQDWKITAANVQSDYLSTQIVEQSRVGGSVQYDILVEMKPDAPAGVLRDRLSLVTNELGNPEVVIPVEARIEPDVVVTDAHFGVLSPGLPRSMTVILRGKKPIQIEQVQHIEHEDIAKDRDGLAVTAVRSDNQNADANDGFKIDFPTTVAQIHKLTVTVTPPPEAGTFDEHFSVSISGRKQPITFKANGRILDQAAAALTR